MYPSDSLSKFQLRLPVELKRFIEREAQRNGCSQNSEVIRSIRERMDRHKSEGPIAPTTSPSVAIIENLAQDNSK